MLNTAAPSQAIIEDTEHRLSILDSLDGNYLRKIIGDTPLSSIELPSGPVLVKEEFRNPTGSHYDRAYVDLITQLEEAGLMEPGDVLRDISSGSAAISLAGISRVMGYCAEIILPPELPMNRVYPAEKFGAIIIRCGEGYVYAASGHQAAEIAKLKADPKYTLVRPDIESPFGRALIFKPNDENQPRICYLNHSEQPTSPQAFSEIADELHKQAPNATDLILAIGNWTTIAGIAPRARELFGPNLRITGYRGPISQTTENFGTTVKLPGHEFSFENPDLLDFTLGIDDSQRDAMARVAPHLGRSSCMGLAVAEKILRENPEAVPVTIGYDLSIRY